MEESKQQMPEPSRPQQMKAWVMNRYYVRNKRDTYVWRVATGSTAMFGSLSMLTAALGMPTGFGTFVDLILFLSANIIAMFAASFLLTFIFSLMYIPLPRRFISTVLYVVIETYLILYFAEFGRMMSIALAAAFAFIGAFAGVLIGLLYRWETKAVRKIGIAFLTALLSVAIFKFSDWPAPADIPQREEAQSGQAADWRRPLQIPNPAEKGNLTVQTFTYGSGKDKHRNWFGDQVDVRTASVDASGYITKWPKLKTFFWGFDEHALPLNGQVWMPKEAGTYPLALIVHGNHLMEHFSDGGYRYLGELLASKGIIAVSVDENFLNYSVWSGIPNHDMKMRAWVLLKHLQQIQQLNEQTENPLSGRVDLSRVALVGHSRGGQAAAMAADADRWFKQDQTIDSLEHIHIESVIAIAPTDKKVDKQSARLVDVNYLTLQGARDADVNNFYGDRQYSRVSFGPQSDKFKAALYIEDANHSQFNSDWGSMDERPPGGLFLNRKGLLESEDQRQLSKVYISAFLEATLLGEREYAALFRDYRSGLDWLPSTGYMNRYEESGFTEIARFEQSSKTVLNDGGKAAAQGMKQWQVTFAEDRDGKSKGTKGIELEWAEPGAEYKLELSSSTVELAEQLSDPSLVFSMANLERDLIDLNEEDLKPVKAEEIALPPLPELEVVLTMSDGGTRKLELDAIMPVPPSVYTAFMSLSWLEERMKDEKYKEPTEPVFQTYILPIEQFGTEETVIALNEIRQITFRFVSGPGKVMLNDIGFISK